jgi:ATPase family associated with various cellular activities (AAA)
MQSAGIQFALLNNLPRTGFILADALISVAAVALIAWISQAWTPTIWPFLQRLLRFGAGRFYVRRFNYEGRFEGQHFSQVSGNRMSLDVAANWLTKNKVPFNECELSVSVLYPEYKFEPNSEAWTPLLDYCGIEVRGWKTVTAHENYTTTCNTIEFRGLDVVQLNQFLEMMLKDYWEDNEKKHKETTTYQYIPHIGKCLKDGKFVEIITQRYSLVNEKSFDSLFFPEKNNILELVYDFENRTGRFSLPGVPRKIGVLLHGPPGTGKTSFIKALANKTKRNIFMIDLAAVAKSKCLFHALMHLLDVKTHNRSCSSPIDAYLNYGNTIFVLEEIDAASVTHDRKPKEKEEIYPKEQYDGRVQFITTGPAQPPPPETDPPLDISDVLTALDGILDTPDRIVVMTTNHFEKIDPALFRPGRIDECIHLTNMTPDCAEEMLRHSYPDVSDEQMQRFKTVVQTSSQLTAAKLQQLMVKYYPNVDNIISNA